MCSHQTKWTVSPAKSNVGCIKKHLDRCTTRSPKFRVIPNPLSPDVLLQGLLNTRFPTVGPKWTLATSLQPLSLAHLRSPTAVTAASGIHRQGPSPISGYL
ncbi:hypothetical protein N7468_007609 [Penicillium chermesinum]|uniref:Uncharacterized protein n=1 Tax=Penicillium chermesinum TaxID=63820 RepID=A0A9W9TKZ6_9EURO|nr:uncharacterized protein N7468_007609 [Penicillium chermesinum]KAJ5226384.1 hypothetical protein N7468_007609 [Penicillium chermesinum]